MIIIYLDQGLDTITVNTDSDGRATVAFILGPNAGNDSNIMEASFQGNTGPPASFTATALIPGDPGNTKISGIVLDNSNNPIPNVTMRVQGTTREAKTDVQGQFTILNVPVGAIHLIADGTRSTLANFPYALMFEVNTISGRENTIGMPIYLVPIDISNAKPVSPTQYALLSVKNIDGFGLTIP